MPRNAGNIGDTPSEYLIAHSILRGGYEHITFASAIAEVEMKQSTLDLALVRRVLAYDPETGIFTWANPVSARVSAGQRAGVISGNGRRYIGILGEKHIAHRLAWFYHHGVWPVGNVVPENGDYDDARIDNLREETASNTARRASLRNTNTSGHRGVSWSEQKRKWIATITRGYHRVHLGYFDDQEDAVAAYAAAVTELPAGKGVAVPGVDAIALRRRQRTIWQRLVRKHGERLGWSSFAVFVVDVDQIEGLDYDLVALDAARPIGPGNYRWQKPKKSARARVESAYWRQRHLLRKFGLTPDDVDRMAEAQDHRCAICGEPETATRKGVVKALAIDHSHATNRVRSLLCAECNQGIGKMKDNPGFLRAAADYIEKHAAMPLKKDAC